MLNDMYGQLLWLVFFLSYGAGLVTGGLIAYLFLHTPKEDSNEPVHPG